MKGKASVQAMLLALIVAFGLSQAFRTIAGVMAPALQVDLELTASQLGWFAAMFHLVFAASQVFVGAAIDAYGARRVMLAIFPCAVVGAAVSAWAPGYGLLLLGQALIGIGCAPAFLACTVVIAHSFAAERFAALSGITLGLGSLGMLLTASPLAWLIEISSWRAAFQVLGGASIVAWMAVWLVVRVDTRHDGREASLGTVLMGFVRLFAVPHTWGIILLALVVYASIMALRGLWLGPLLVERYGMSLVHSGDVALVMSACMIVSAPIVGRLDPGDRWRRPALLAGTVVLAALFAVLALPVAAGVAMALAWVVGVMSSYTIWQYADVRAAYPPAVLGRAIGLFTMAMFMGVAIMQALTGWVADQAVQYGVEPYSAVFWLIAILLVAGAIAFLTLPQPRERASQSA